MKGYTAYILNQGSRDYLKTLYTPQYSRFIGHHITYEFGVDETAVNRMPSVNIAEVIGYIDDRKGLECFLVSVGENWIRPDGGYMHLTWSLSPELGYKPKHSNDVLKASDNVYRAPVNHIPLTVKPEFIPFK